MMMEKERGALKDNEFPSLWEQIDLAQKHNGKRYLSSPEGLTKEI